MKTWTINIELNNKYKEEISLFDVKKYFDGYLTIKRSFFNSITKTINISKNYIAARGIESVFSPNKEDWSLNPWILLIIKDKEKKKQFFFLIKREKDISGLLIALGPKEFADYSNNNSDVKREIMRILNYINTYLNKFNCIILLPNYLS
ncbi:MAG: hypothetical protein KGD57_02635 [Candidatus Lokiarchaeota archaeon]|nr:hypothetical protein [Candidatus Lokiarchaeota archaeon]